MLQSPVIIRDGELKIEDEPLTFHIVTAKWEFAFHESTQNTTFHGDIPPLTNRTRSSAITLNVKFDKDDNERLEIMQKYRNDNKINILMSDTNHNLEGKLTLDDHPDMHSIRQEVYVTLRGWFSHQA